MMKGSSMFSGSRIATILVTLLLSAFMAIPVFAQETTPTPEPTPTSTPRGNLYRPGTSLTHVRRHR